MSRTAADGPVPAVRGRVTVLALAVAVVFAAPSASPAQQRGGGEARAGLGLGAAIKRMFSPLARKPGTRRPYSAQTPRPLAVPDLLRGEVLVAFAGGTSDAAINRYLRRRGLVRIDESRNTLLGQRIVRAHSAAARRPGRSSSIFGGGRVQPNRRYGVQAGQGGN